jgi:hypothetical protein
MADIARLNDISPISPAVSLHTSELCPVEVKCRASVEKKHLEGPHGFGHGVLVTKDDIWTHRTYSALPAPFFLLLT